jgi:hypothetical protein
MWCIKAAISPKDVGNSKVEKVVDLLNVKNSISLNQGIVKNVNNQVELALIKFKDRIKTKKLVVISKVYDFQNTFGQGLGRLIITNVNEYKDAEEILKSQYFKNNTSKVIVMKSIAMNIFDL